MDSTLLIAITGIAGFLNMLFYKWGVWLFFQRKASSSNSRLVYEAANCSFCRVFYLSILVSALVGVMTGFSAVLFLAPFISSGFNSNN